MYSYHGVTLPEQYGQIHPQQWQAKWLFDENNAKVKHILIQAIGYSRICQELQVSELDSWQEYTLLRIDSADVEPIYLLKVTYPSVEAIHTLRVPPTRPSAQEAIHWLHLEIDPAKFPRT